jgi:rhamnosyltransferase
MYFRIREQGYLTISINCKLVDHKLGQRRWIKILSNISRKPSDYEPPWRYYYIVRNSTKLLLENRLDFKTYIDQLMYWGIRIIFADGIKVFIKSFGLGLIHALLNKFGYLDRRIFERNA